MNITEAISRRIEAYAFRKARVQRTINLLAALRQEGADAGAEHDAGDDGGEVDDALQEERRHHQHQHADRGHHVAAHRGLRRAERAHAEDQQHGAREIGVLDELLDHVLSGFFLNMASMRLVTRNPPTTLIVAKPMAFKPSSVESVRSP